MKKSVKKSMSLMMTLLMMFGMFVGATSIFAQEESPEQEVVSNSTKKNAELSSSTTGAGDISKTVSESPLELEEATGKIPLESVPTANSQKVTVRFNFKYVKKATVDIELNEGESIGDRLPTVADTQVYIDSEKSLANIELNGYTSNGKLYTLDELRTMPITQDMTFDAYYMVNSTFQYVLYDGREESKQLSADELEKSLLEMSLFNEKTNEEYKSGKLKRISYEKQKSIMGDDRIISKYRYDATVKMPLTDINGNLINYSFFNKKLNADYDQPFIKTAFVSRATSANSYGGMIQLNTNYSPWFWVKVSDASAENPVDVKVKIEQSYPNSYIKELINAEKNFTVTVKDGKAQYKFLSDKTNDPKDLFVDNGYWRNNGRIYTTTDYGEYELIKRNAYGAVVLTAKPEEIEGYTLVKVGDGTSKNNGRRYDDAFFFSYFKNLNFKFNAKAGDTTILDTKEDIKDVKMLHTRKVNPLEIPSVNPVKNKTFLGWAEKNEPNKIVDFSNMIAEKNMEFIPVFDDAPVINAKDVYVYVNEQFDPLKNVSAIDKEDGPIVLTKDNIVSNNVDTSKAGTYHVTFRVADKSKNITEKTITVTVHLKAGIINHAPTLVVKDETIKVGEKIDLNSLIVKAEDKEDGDLIKAVKLIDDGGFNKVKVGKYTVTFKVTDKDGASATKRAIVTVKYGLATMNEAPTLEVKDKTIKQSEALDLKSLVVSAKDKEDGDLIKAVKLTDNGGFNKDKVGKYTVTFKVTDKDGASATKKATVTVIEKDKPLPNPEKNKPKYDNSKSKVQDDRISPKTGDSYNLSQYGMLLGLSGILLAAIEIRKRRKES